MLKQANIDTPKWIALKLLENDKNVIDKLYQLNKSKGAIISQVLEKAKSLQKHLSMIFGQDVDVIIADARYGFIRDGLFSLFI